MPERVNIAIVPVEGDLDVTTVPAVRRRIDALVGHGCRRVFLNMADASYVDSAGMGLILSELRRMRGLGGLLSLSNVSAQLYQALLRLRVLDLMPVERRGARRSVDELPAAALPQWRTTFRADAATLADARERVGRLLARTSLTSDEVFDMKLASGEALGNAVDHTCGDGVLVTVAAYPDRVAVDVTDCGSGFELAAGEEPPEAGPLAERGRGIRLMRLLADAVSISRKSAGAGTVVHLVKLLDAHAAARA